jgi:hypothetical protein
MSGGMRGKAIAVAILAAALVRAAGAPPAAVGDEAAPKPAPKAASGAESDLARKAEIMNSPRWRRAIFELGEWLSTQKIYPPKEVVRIKSEFNHRVARMSSHELEYLLDDLDAKFKILDTPEAMEARAWVGQYMSVMSDRKREEALKDVPDVVKMSAGQLQQELQKIEQKRASLQQQQAAFDAGRQQLVEQAQLARQQTAQASRMGQPPGGGAAYSPYRRQGEGKPPFSEARGSGMTVYSGPFGGGVAVNIGNF